MRGRRVHGSGSGCRVHAPVSKETEDLVKPRLLSGLRSEECSYLCRIELGG
jgi:hypothetical protein